jgi:hypothetical protein
MIAEVITGVLAGVAIAVMITIGTLAAWIGGVFNPLGYLGVRPRDVPACTCDRGPRAYMHDMSCAITERRPR